MSDKLHDDEKHGAMNVTRRGFLQGFAAGFAVAAMPVAISLSERTEAATTILQAPGWKFVIRGGSGIIGDSLTMVLPGNQFREWDDDYILAFPDPLNVNRIMESQPNQIRLIPWRPYLKQFEHLIPEDMWHKYQKARLWKRR